MIQIRADKSREIWVGVEKVAKSAPKWAEEKRISDEHDYISPEEVKILRDAWMVIQRKCIRDARKTWREELSAEIAGALTDHGFHPDPR